MCLICMTKIILKKKCIDEFEDYYKWYKLKANQRLIGCSLPKTKKGNLGVFKKSLSDKKNYEYSVYVNGELIGVGQIYLKKNNVGGVFILIGDKKFRGKGYGCEILKQLIKIGFDKLKLIKLKATIIEYNKKSISLFKKFGFKLTKIKKKSWKYNAIYYDEYVFELLRAEWECNSFGEAKIGKSLSSGEL